MVLKHGGEFQAGRTHETEPSSLFQRFLSESNPEKRLALVTEAREDGLLNTLSKEEQKQVIRTIVADYANQLADKQTSRSSSESAIEVTDAFLPRSRFFDQEDIVDTYTELMPEFLVEYPEAARQLTDQLDSNAQVVRPETYIRSLGTILRQPGIASIDRTSALAGLSYQASFGLLPFLEEAIERVEDAPVEEGASLLTLLAGTVEYGEGFDFSEDSSRAIERMLQEFPRRTNSALLKRKAEAIIHGVSDAGMYWPPEGVRAWMMYNPHDFPDVDPRQVKSFSDEEVMRRWHAALEDPDFRRLVRENDYSFELDRAKERFGTQQLTIEGVRPERVTILPVNAEYYGVVNRGGQIQTLVRREEGVNIYPRSTLRSVHELPEFAVQPWMDAAERERALQAQRDYQTLLDQELLNGLERDYGFPVRELTMREQVWFMASLRDLSPKDEPRIMDFTRKFGLNGARAFLATEQDPIFRETILKLDEKLTVRQAGLVLARYAEISSVAQRSVADILGKTLDSRRATLDAFGFQKELLARARTLLMKAGRVHTDELLRELKATEVDTVLFASICKSYFKHNSEARLDAVRGLTLEAMPRSGLSRAEKLQMLSIEKENWKEIPTMSDFVLKEFEAKLEHGDEPRRFYVMKKEGRIVAFIRFDEKPNGTLYAGSFNVAPELRGSALGEEMLRETMDKEAALRPVVANVYPNAVVGTSYVERFGFVIVGVEDIELPDGGKEQDFLILRDDAVNGEYAARSSDVTADQIRNAVSHPETLEKYGVTVRRYELPSQPHDQRKDKSRMLRDVAEAAARGEYVTRYLTDPKDPFIRYLAFEQKRERLKQAA